MPSRCDMGNSDIFHLQIVWHILHTNLFWTREQVTQSSNLQTKVVIHQYSKSSFSFGQKRYFSVAVWFWCPSSTCALNIHWKNLPIINCCQIMFLWWTDLCFTRNDHSGDWLAWNLPRSFILNQLPILSSILVHTREKQAACTSSLRQVNGCIYDFGTHHDLVMAWCSRPVRFRKEWRQFKSEMM